MPCTIVMATTLGRQDGGLVAGLASFMEFENVKTPNDSPNNVISNNEINKRSFYLVHTWFHQIHQRIKIDHAKHLHLLETKKKS